MAACGVMRIEKRGRSAVYGLQIEACRTEKDHAGGRDFHDSDIDWTKTDENIFLVKSDSWNSKITGQLRQAGVRERKNSIVLLDGLYTASPEFFAQHPKEDWIAYFRDCLQFHIKEFCQGDSARMLSAVIHLDEKTPHLQVASVPLMQDGDGFHLSAKTIMGGRKEYRSRQDRFYEEVTKKRGLDRGEVRDPAERKRHVSKREWQLHEQQERAEALEGRVRKAEEIRDATVERSFFRKKQTVRLQYEEYMDLRKTAEAVQDVQAYERTVQEAERAVQEKEGRADAMLREAGRRKKQADKALQEAQAQARQAQQDAEKARKYKEQEEDYIFGTAKNIADAKIDEIMADEPRSRTGRLEKLCSDLKMKDGRSVLDLFEEQEQKLRAKLNRWDMER